MSVGELIRYMWENPDEVILIWPYYIIFAVAAIIFMVHFLC